MVFKTILVSSVLYESRNGLESTWRCLNERRMKCIFSYLILGVNIITQKLLEEFILTSLAYMLYECVSSRLDSETDALSIVARRFIRSAGADF